MELKKHLLTRFSRHSFYAAILRNQALAVKLAILISVGSAGMAVLQVARSHTLDLVNYVVCNAYLLKCPQEVDTQSAHAVFEDAMSRVRERRVDRDEHLQKLFEISQRLEKIQRLTEKEALDILESLRK